MLVKSLFLCPSKRCRSRDLENKMPRSSEVYMVPKKVSAVKEVFHFMTPRYENTHKPLCLVGKNLTKW